MYVDILYFIRAVNSMDTNHILKFLKESLKCKDVSKSNSTVEMYQNPTEMLRFFLTTRMDKKIGIKKRGRRSEQF